MPPPKKIIRDRCDVCDRIIEPNPEMGDRQGGHTQIVLQATTWDIYLCEDHKKPLFDLYHAHKRGVTIRGTVVGVEALQYLPRENEATLEPPRFSSE